MHDLYYCVVQLWCLLQRADRVEELQHWVERHKFHIQKLEVRKKRKESE